MRRTVPPSAEIEDRIDELLAVGVGENARESLSELAKLGARLIIQRAVEEEFDAWLGRTRYERRPDYQRGLRNFDSGLRNGYRSRRVQTAEGELSVEVPQVREAAEPFVSKLFPHSTKLLRTRPLEAMVVGAFVRGAIGGMELSPSGEKIGEKRDGAFRISIGRTSGAGAFFWAKAVKLPKSKNAKRAKKHKAPPRGKEPRH